MEGTCRDLFQTWRRQKKSLMTFQSGSQPCVDYTSLATKLVLLWNHFSPWSLNRHLYGSWKGFPASFLGRIMTPHVEGMSAFYLTVWDSREGKFNENTSEVMGEMSAFSLITAFFSPLSRRNSCWTWWLCAVRGVNDGFVVFFLPTPSPALFVLTGVMPSYTKKRVSLRPVLGVTCHPS